MTELPKHIEDKIEQIWGESQTKFVTQKRDDILNSINSTCTVTQLRQKVEDFNSALNYVFGDGEDYDFSKFRKFVKGQEVILLQHPEVVSEIDRLYQVNNELYNLIDFEEINVNVHRNGEN